MPYSNPDKVISQIWRSDDPRRIPPIYAILDAARNERIHPAIVDFEGEFCCLYGEKVPDVLAKVAPYLVRLRSNDSFTTWLISEGWGDSWGIFLESDTDMEELREHFRGLLKVKDEEGAELFFRYYDPRVLRVYLPTCNEEEADMFFGKVTSFFVEGEDPNELCRYSRGYSGWTYDIIPLS